MPKVNKYKKKYKEMQRFVEENFKNNDIMFHFIQGNGIEQIILKIDRRKGIRMVSEYNWGYTGKVKYYWIDLKDKYLENICDVDLNKEIIPSEAIIDFSAQGYLETSIEYLQRIEEEDE